VSSRGVNPDPATLPSLIEPDTSSATSRRLPVGVTAWKRDKRRPERGDDLLVRLPPMPLRPSASIGACAISTFSDGCATARAIGVARMAQTSRSRREGASSPTWVIFPELADERRHRIPPPEWKERLPDLRCASASVGTHSRGSRWSDDRTSSAVSFVREARSNAHTRRRSDPGAAPRRSRASLDPRSGAVPSAYAWVRTGRARRRMSRWSSRLAAGTSRAAARGGPDPWCVPALECPAQHRPPAPMLDPAIDLDRRQPLRRLGELKRCSRSAQPFGTVSAAAGRLAGPRQSASARNAPGVRSARVPWCRPR